MLVGDPTVGNTGIAGIHYAAFRKAVVPVIHSCIMLFDTERSGMYQRPKRSGLNPSR